MDDIESRRAASSSATQDKKRQRRRGNRNRFPTSSNASIQPSQPQPPLPPAAPEIKPSGLNGLFDDDHGGEAQPIATSSKSPISLNDASPSSSSCDEGKPPLIATSATPPHKRRKKKGSSVQLQETLPTQQQATHAVPIMGGVRARMMAQDKERQEYRLDEEQDTQASQDEAVVPASAASQAAYKQLEKSLADARKARSDADAELTRLRNEMRFKNEVIAAQSSSLSYLHNQATCTICLELSWRPHVLTPCGHSFCARCLIDWFKRPLPDEDPIPSFYDAEQRQRLEQQATHRRKKICPHCRTKVVGPPAEIWAVKGMVDRLHQSHMLGHMAGSGAGDDHHHHHLGAVVIRTPDEEAKFRGEDLASGEDLWSPIFDINGPRERIFDEGDLIWRCGYCTGEIAWGECQNCHRAYTMTDDGEDEDIDGLGYDDYSSEGAGDEDESGESEVGEVLERIANGYRLDNAYGGHHDEDEDDEEAEMGSFIVSDADGSVMGTEHSAGSDESEDGLELVGHEHSYAHHYGGPSASSRRRYGYSDDEENFDSDDDHDDNVSAASGSSSSIQSSQSYSHRIAPRHHRGSQRRLTVPDDDDEEEGDEANVNTMLDGHRGSSGSNSGPSGRRRVAVQVSFNDDDDESEGEDGIVSAAEEDEDEDGGEDGDGEGDEDGASSGVGHGRPTSYRSHGAVAGRASGRHARRPTVVTDSDEEQDSDDDMAQARARMSAMYEQPRRGTGSRYNYDEEEEDDEYY